MLKRLSGEFGFDYILIKMPDTIPHVPRDVDILVHGGDRSKALAALDRYNMRFYSEVCGASLAGEYWAIDLYETIRYFGLVGLSHEHLWKARQETELFGVRFPGLSPELNFLLTLMHGVFGHRRLTLLDLLHLQALRKAVNLSICRSLARSDGWDEAFDLVVDKVDSISRDMLSGKYHDFPYILERGYVLTLFSAINGISLTRRRKAFLSSLLIRERAVRAIERTRLYEHVRKRIILRHFLNSVLSRMTGLVEKGLEIGRR